MSIPLSRVARRGIRSATCRLEEHTTSKREAKGKKMIKMKMMMSGDGDDGDADMAGGRG